MREQQRGVGGAGVIEVPVDGVFDEAEAEQADLVGLQLGGSRPPLFLIRTWTGEVANHRRLARHLGPDQPIYSFAPPRGTRPEDFPKDAQEWAERVLLALARGSACGALFHRRLVVRGRDRARGGGAAASSPGRTVALLAMLDTRLPKQWPVRRRGQQAAQRASQECASRLDRFLELRQRARAARVSARARRAPRREARGPLGARCAGGRRRDATAAASRRPRNRSRTPAS